MTFKLESKSIKNAFQNPFRFLNVVLWILISNSMPQTLQKCGFPLRFYRFFIKSPFSTLIAILIKKSSKNKSKIHSKSIKNVFRNLLQNVIAFLIDVWWILTSKMEPKSSLGRRWDRLGIDFGPGTLPEGPQTSFWMLFWSILTDLWMILDAFWMTFSRFLWMLLWSILTDLWKMLDAFWMTFSRCWLNFGVMFWRKL